MSDLWIKRKLSEVILPSEDYRPSEGMVANDAGILVPTSLLNELDWPTPCNKDDFRIVVHYRAMNRDSEFFGELSKGDSGYIFKAELFMDEALFPGVVFNYVPSQTISDTEIDRIVVQWAGVSKDINVYQPFATKPQEYCKYSIRHNGVAMTILDFDLQNAFSRYLANYMVSYIYKWIVSLWGARETLLKNFIFTQMPIFGQKIDLGDFLPREIELKKRK